MSRWAALAAVVIGCGHAAPAPSPTLGVTHAAPADAAVDAAPLALDDDLPRLAERSIELYRDWRTALADGDDCAAAAAKVNAVADAYADVTAAQQRVIRAGRAKVKQLRDALGTKLDDDAQVILHSPALTRCSSDAGFAHAMDRLGGES